jgi:signal transduction histidine kinase
MNPSGTTVDLFPFASSRGVRFGMPTKPSVILVRWPVVIICSYLLLYPSVHLVPAFVLNVFILLYVASNVALYFVNDEVFASPSFYSPLVIADTTVLTMSLVINGNVEADFYLTYFLLIIICCIFENPKILAILSVLAPVIYTLLLFRSPGRFDPSLFLRLPFLFIVSLFYGYFAQLVRAEKAAKEEAEQKNRGKKEALDIVSHEFRTPLNLIGGYAQALKDQILGDISPEQRDALVKILRQTDVLMYMVDSILDLARIEAGEFSVQQDEIVLSDYFRQLKINYEVPLEKPVAVHWSLPSELPTLRSDRAKLTIILQNLINNAIKFTDRGFVEITVRVQGDKKHLEVQVADTGVGIPKEAIPVIFEKFRQADSSSTRSHGGVGLGLHIVKVFSELLGGSVTVRSEPDQGSAFTLLLPI